MFSNFNESRDDATEHVMVQSNSILFGVIDHVILNKTTFYWITLLRWCFLPSVPETILITHTIVPSVVAPPFILSIWYLCRKSVKNDQVKITNGWNLLTCTLLIKMGTRPQLCSRHRIFVLLCWMLTLTWDPIKFSNMFAKINLKEYLKLKHVWNRQITSRSTSSPPVMLLGCSLVQHFICSIAYLDSIMMLFALFVLKM